MSPDDISKSLVDGLTTDAHAQVDRHREHIEAAIYQATLSLRSRCEAAETEVERWGRRNNALAEENAALRVRALAAEARSERLEGALREIADSFEDFGRPWDRLPGSIVAARAALEETP